jgi:hypothetical protein
MRMSFTKLCLKRAWGLYDGDSIWESEFVSNWEVATCLFYALSLSLYFSPFCKGCPKSFATLVILQSK